MISTGVLMTRSSQSMIRTLPRVMTTVTIRESTAALPTLFFIPSISPAPKRWAVRIVNPVVSPCRKPRIRNMIVPVAPTAASAFTPTYLPTITVSTRLYSCWNIFPIIMGIINFVISLRGLPFVISSSIPSLSFYSSRHFSKNNYIFTEKDAEKIFPHLIFQSISMKGAPFYLKPSYTLSLSKSPSSAPSAPILSIFIVRRRILAFSEASNM